MLKANQIPYFARDRKQTVKDIKSLLKQHDKKWIKTIAWIMREAAFDDVWEFITPKEAWTNFNHIKPFLGRKQRFWKYILGMWHELGKI